MRTVTLTKSLSVVVSGSGYPAQYCLCALQCYDHDVADAVADANDDDDDDDDDDDNEDDDDADDAGDDDATAAVVAVLTSAWSVNACPA